MLRDLAEEQFQWTAAGATFFTALFRPFVRRPTDGQPGGRTYQLPFNKHLRIIGPYRTQPAVAQFEVRLSEPDPDQKWSIRSAVEEGEGVTLLNEIGSGAFVSRLLPAGILGLEPHEFVPSPRGGAPDLRSALEAPEYASTVYMRLGDNPPERVTVLVELLRNDKPVAQRDVQLISALQAGADH